jgi:branched-chain amino acid aminotransferase
MSNGFQELASVDGTITPTAAATIGLKDDGLYRGDGAFEVIRLYGGKPFALVDHLDRLERSTAAIQLSFDRAALEAEIGALLGEAGPVEGQLRLIVTRGGRRLAMIEPLPQLPNSIALARVTYVPTLVLDGIKSLSYAANMLAGRLARERGYDEALLVTPQEEVLECPTASFFWVRDGELLTPPLDDHVLDSITRRLIIALAGAREQSTAFADLASAQEAFIASSVREVLPVHRIEEQELRGGGPVTQRAAAAVREEIRSRLG